MVSSGAELEVRGRREHAAGDYRAALATYEEAFARYREAGETIAAARCARTVGWFRGWVFGEWAVYRGWVARACDLLEQGAGASAQGWIRFEEARRGDDLETQRGQYLEAVELARRAGDVDLECEATAALGLMLVFSGRVEEGMAYLDRALAVICGGGVDELPVLEGCLCGLFNACERTQDVERAQQWLAATEDVVRAGNLTTAAGYCRSHYAGILTSAGRWGDAEAELHQAIALLGERDALRGSAVCRLAALRVRQGRTEDAAILLHGLDDHEDATLPLVRLNLARDRPSVALELLDRVLAAGDLADYAEAPLRALAVDCHLALDQPEDARAQSERLTALADAQPSTPVKALAAVARARVAAAAGGHDPRAAWHEAIALFGASRMPVEAALARLDLAHFLAAEQPEVAVADASAAFDVLEAAGAVRAADEAAALLRELGATARTGPKQEATLTKREGEVLALVGHGLTNAEIAERLYISPKTVEHHVGRVLAKLGFRSRTEAAAYAVRSGRI